MKKKLHILLLNLITTILFSQNTSPSSIETSIIPLQLSPRPNPMLHIGGMRTVNDEIRLMTGMQFQPTKNLLIGGVLSPHRIGSDISLYYHIAIGYISKWKLFNTSSNMFQIGIHRNRFDKDDNDTRWFSFSIMEKTRFGRLNLNFCWNRLFNKKWENNSILISTDLKVSHNIFLRPGAIFFLDDLEWKSDDYFTPFIIVSLHL